MLIKYVEFSCNLELFIPWWKCVNYAQQTTRYYIQVFIALPMRNYIQQVSATKPEISISIIRKLLIPFIMIVYTNAAAILLKLWSFSVPTTPVLLQSATKEIH